MKKYILKAKLKTRRTEKVLKVGGQKIIFVTKC